MQRVKLETILDAAYKVFVKFGYQKTSVEDIAKEAMINKGTIYYHFKTKEDIFIAVFSKIDESIRAAIIKKIKKADSFEEKLKVFFTEPFKQFETYHQLTINVWNDDLPVFMEKLHDFKLSTIEIMKKLLLEILNEGRDSGVLRENIIKQTEEITEIIFRFFNHARNFDKLKINEMVLRESMHKSLLFYDILIHGLVKKETNQ